MSTRHHQSLPVFAVQGIEDASLVVMARVYNTTRTPSPFASIASCSLRVHDMADGSQTYLAVVTLIPGSTADPLTPATANYFDTLQADARWRTDDEDNPGDGGYYGYNFLYVIPPEAFPHGDRTYQVEGVFTLTDGAVGIALWQNKTTRVFGS